MNHTGWRKPTPEICIAEQHAKAGEGLSVPKNTAMLAIKRVAAHLGLKASDIMLLDTFGAFTKPQDWEQGRRPIIWASNAYLMEQTGFSLSALKRHARRLVEAGLICFRDSANGKRWGHRDDQGYIIEAYGFDLSPLAARAEEFNCLFTQIQKNRQLCQRTKRQITITRRIIRAKVNQAVENRLQGPWKALSAKFNALLLKLPRANAAPQQLLDMLQWLTDLKDRVEHTYQSAIRHEEKVVENTAIIQEQSSGEAGEMNPEGSKNEPHILDTKQLNPVKSNSIGPRETEPLAAKNSGIPKLSARNWSTFGKRRQDTEINISTIMLSCPGFAEIARDIGEFVTDWTQLHRVAGQIRPMLGISVDGWNIAQKYLGPQIAAAAIALIFEKFSAGEIASPGGYLRGIVEKFGAGELHLDRSFYGRMKDLKAA